MHHHTPQGSVHGPRTGELGQQPDGVAFASYRGFAESIIDNRALDTPLQEKLDDFETGRRRLSRTR